VFETGRIQCSTGCGCRTPDDIRHVYTLAVPTGFVVVADDMHLRGVPGNTGHRGKPFERLSLHHNLLVTLADGKSRDIGG
jgi:hypothetical protein